MQFLTHAIPDPPAECITGDICEDIVKKVAMLAALTSAVAKELGPKNVVEMTDPDAQSGGVVKGTALVNSAVPEALERTIPPAERCAGCVITCAMNVLHDKDI